MKNPFLNPDQYSFVKNYNKIQPKKPQSTAYKPRVKSLDNSYFASINFSTTISKQIEYSRQQNARKRIEYEGAKLYGLDSLRYKPELGLESVQSNQPKQTYEVSSSKEVDQVKNTQTKSTNDFYEMPAMDEKIFEEKEKKYFQKKRKLSKNFPASERKCSMLTSMLNLNFKSNKNNVDDYDSDEDQTITTGQEIIRKKSRTDSLSSLSKKASFNSGQKLKKNSGFSGVVIEEVQENKNLFKNFSNFQQKQVKIGSENERKSSFTKRGSRRSELQSLKLLRKKSRKDIPDFLYFRGFKYYKYEKKLLRS